MKRKRNSDKISKALSSGPSINEISSNCANDKVVNYREEIAKLKEFNYNQSTEIQRLKSIEDDYKKLVSIMKIENSDIIKIVKAKQWGQVIRLLMEADSSEVDHKGKILKLKFSGASLIHAVCQSGELSFCE